MADQGDPIVWSQRLTDMGGLNMTSDALVSKAPRFGSDPQGARSSLTRPSRTTARPAAPSRDSRPGRWRRWRGIGGALVATTLLILSTVGCASIRPRETPPPVSAAWQPGELLPVDTKGRGLLLVRPDHQLGRYDALMIEHVGFRYSDHQRWLSFREEDRISAMITNAVKGMQDGEVTVTDESGPCVLGVRFYVTDLELHDPGYETTSVTSFVRSFGEATMIMELRDTVTDRPLARFLQRRDLGGGPGFGTGTSIRRLETVVGVAMREMGGQLQKLTPPTSRGWQNGCSGGMTRVAFGSH